MKQNNAIQLTRDQQASLNNLRAVIKRQLRPTSSLDPSLVADIILKNSDMMREAGLAKEQFEYLSQIRDRVKEGTTLFARLTTHLASMMDVVDELRDSAEETHQEALQTFQQLDEEKVKPYYAEAQIAYGRHLIGISKLPEAAEHYTKAIDMLGNTGLQSAVARGELGRAYVGQGKFDEAADHFKEALASIDDSAENADEKARVQADYATALIQLEKIDDAREHLNQALSVAEDVGLWTLRGQIHRELAYIDQVEADNAQDDAVIKSHLDQAQTRLKQTITDLLPISDTLGLAVAYHDLGRLEARQRNFNDAKSHVEMSSEMFERIGNRRNYAVAEVTLGQIVLFQNGDVNSANQHLHRALTLATELKDEHTKNTAAESLLRIHSFQAKRAVSDKPNIRHQVIDQISYSLAKFKDLGMENQAESLNPLIAQLEAVEKSGDAPTAR